MQHRWITEDDLASCLTCGAAYDVGDEAVSGCTGRTDLIHTYDVHNSGHPLDCPEADATGVCGHMDLECDCRLCNG